MVRLVKVNCMGPVSVRIFPRLLPPMPRYRRQELPILYPAHGSLRKIQPIGPLAMNLPPLAPQPPGPPDRPDLLMEKAREMETAFLAEMLAHSGLEERQGPFGGGEGEAQFTSFLRQEQARLTVEKGGIGLAELIFRTMSKASHDSP
jgi:hypothetical protein